jgi:membrane associated rhomboid family serine protease
MASSPNPLEALMILPIGHQESSVRRLPWVSFAIIAICFLSFLMTDTSAVDDAPDANMFLEDAVDYWRQHAYLEADSKIVTVVSYDVMPNQRKQYIELTRIQAADSKPRDPKRLQEQQAKLNRLTDLALGNAIPEDLAEANNPFRRWGMTPGDIKWYTLLTHIFMHAGWLHLISNMFMFFLAGPPVEDRLGRPLFGALFVTSGIFGALFWAALVQEQNIPLVGASGAVSGMLGAFLLLYWKSDIRFAYFLMFGLRPVMGTFEAKAWVMLPLWFANELFQAWLMASLGVSAGVAYWAHIGGFIFGAGALAAMKALKVEEKFINAAIEAKVTLIESNPVLDEAMELRGEGDHEGALLKLQAAWPQSSSDRDVAMALWDAARAVNRPEEGVEAAMALVRLSSADEDKGVAIGHWTELTRVVPTALVDPGTLMRFVPVLQQQGNEELVVQALRHATDPANAGLTTGLAMKAIDLARAVDPPSALRAAKRAIESPELHEAKRDRLAGMISELEGSGVEDVPDVVQAEQARETAAQDRGIELPDDDWDYDRGRTLEAPPPVPPLMPPPIPRPSADPQPPAVPQPGMVPPPLPPARAADPEPLALSADGGLVSDEGRTHIADVLAETFAEDEIDFADMGVDAEDVARFSTAKIVEATPTALTDEALRMLVSQDQKAKIEYPTIQAVAVAAVKGIGPKPVLLVDLLLNWNTSEDVPLRVIRLKSTSFDPRKLVPGAASPLDALRDLVSTLVQRSGAVVLPDASVVEGGAFEVFEDLDGYQSRVLQVAG